ncbi:ABC transporter ATP-binding protein [Natrialbaceae archaeon A-CW3]
MTIRSPTEERATTEPILSVDDLKKYYPITSGILNRHVGDVKAVDGVSFDLYPGETLAIVGESGCGKSTLAETLLQLHEPTAGSVRYDGTDLATLGRSELREVRRDLQMIFQDPSASLNDRMTVGRIVKEPMSIHGGVENPAERVRELLSVVGLDPDDHYNRFSHELSGGQCQRVGIARALALNPSVIVADEPVSALDVSVQAQILSLLEDLQESYDLTFLFVSHDMSVVRHVADRVAVMYLGRIVELTDVETLFEDPKHPYTQSLLSSVPTVGTGGRSDDRIHLEGAPPDPADPPAGCNFHPRCQLKPELGEGDQQQCELEDPQLEDTETGTVACHHWTI